MGWKERKQAIEMMRDDKRRGVYEAGDFTGKRGIGEFFVDYGTDGWRSPTLDREDVKSLVAEGWIVKSYPDCDGLFKRGPRWARP